MKDVTNKIIYISSAVIFLGLIACAFYIGLRKDTDTMENDVMLSRAVVYAEPPLSSAEDEKLPLTIENAEDVEESLEDRITSNTKIIYEYFYEDTEETVKYEDTPKYFHLDKTEKMFKDIYMDWDIISFSNEEVVLRKVVEAPKSRSYTLGVYNGNVAVFYADAEEGTDAIKEVTGTPITSLSQAEQEKLLNGIPISDEDSLIKMLEDYSS